MDTTSLGDRMKSYEAAETSRRLMPLLPAYVRLDGRSFTRFTKDMDKPFDRDMVAVMVETTKRLVHETDACLGYTQSDEISLVLYRDQFKSQHIFDGKLFKMTSVLAGMASTIFLMQYMIKFKDSLPTPLPVFDCRVFNLPNKAEAANMILWREQDATKNAITSAARYDGGFSHKAILGKNGAEKQEMLMEKGINFNDYPTYFKRGTFVRRVQVKENLPDEVWNNIPDQHKPESRLVDRHRLVEVDMPIFSRVINREEVIFQGAGPITEEDPI